MLKNMKLRTKIILGISLLNFFALCGLGLLISISTNTMVTKNSDQELASRLESAVNLIQYSESVETNLSESLKKNILSIKVGKTGYVYVLDPHGNLLVHPTSEGKNIGDQKHTQEIISKKSGRIVYTQTTAGKGFGKKKVAVYQYLPEREYYVVAGSFVDEFYEPLTSLQFYNGLIMAAFFIVSLVFGVLLSNSFVRRIFLIREKLKNISSGSEKADLTRRVDIPVRDEIGDIAALVNKLLDRFNLELLDVRKVSEQVRSSSEESGNFIDTGSGNLEKVRVGTNEINRQIEGSTSSVEELTATVEEMARNIDGIMSSMVRQAYSVEEGASSIEEMVRNIDNTASMSKKTQEISTNLNKVSADGSTAVKTSIQSVKEVADYSQQILKLLGLITNIAKQTNLLAMNAAIEAAHAGEAGKGFAIVADEIRRLSEDTNKNARDIGEVVSSIVMKINESVQLSEKAGVGLDMITAYSQQNAQIIDQLNIAMAEQNNGAKEILKSTQDMVKITEEVKLAMAEQKNATDEFSGALRNLRDLSVENQKQFQNHMFNFTDILEVMGRTKTLIESNRVLALQLHRLVDRFVLAETEPQSNEKTGLKLVE